MEGVECEAVEGAREILERVDSIIFEDSNNASFGESFHRIRQMTGFDIYFRRNGRFERVTKPSEVFRYDASKPPRQSVGINFVAVRPGSQFAQIMALN